MSRAHNCINSLGGHLLTCQSPRKYPASRHPSKQKPGIELASKSTLCTHPNVCRLPPCIQDPDPAPRIRTTKNSPRAGTCSTGTCRVKPIQVSRGNETYQQPPPRSLSIRLGPANFRIRMAGGALTAAAALVPGRGREHSHRARWRPHSPNPYYHYGPASGGAAERYARRTAHGAWPATDAGKIPRRVPGLLERRHWTKSG
ncbi:uncharacterized protein B0H64DRAFT_35913 [Chaetomium fimeti]|uniref:Uncharacterized protein n=1 Tax=Chaetomium fimeti TaxID=1854472 RepID=A0AAE0HRE2_9PEZI|nr:hypothetical protein B0H64DRAFT_35913 [Chaetomium fimeti]